jgi:hypothetical protein
MKRLKSDLALSLLRGAMVLTLVFVFACGGRSETCAVKMNTRGNTLWITCDQIIDCRTLLDKRERLHIQIRAHTDTRSNYMAMYASRPRPPPSPLRRRRMVYLRRSRTGHGRYPQEQAERSRGDARHRPGLGTLDDCRADTLAAEPKPGVHAVTPGVTDERGRFQVLDVHAGVREERANRCGHDTAAVEGRVESDCIEMSQRHGPGKAGRDGETKRRGIAARNGGRGTYVQAAR